MNGYDLGLVYAPSGRQQVQRVLFSPDGRYLTYIGEGGIHLWEVAAKRSVLATKAWAPIAFSPDSRFIAGVFDRDLVIFDVKSRSVKLQLDKPKFTIWAVAFSADGELLATAEGRGPPGQFPCTIRLWDARSGAQRGELIGHKQRVMSLSFSPDGKILAAAEPGSGARPRLWDVANRKEIATLEQPAIAIVFSPNGKLLAGCDNSCIRLWDPVKHKQIRSIHTGAGRVESLAFSPDSKKLLTGGSWHALQLWDVETGRQILPLSGHENTVISLQFSPDGKTLASRGDDLTVRLWDVSTYKERRRFLLGTEGTLLTQRHTAQPVCSLAFSSDNKTLAAIGGANEGGLDNTVHLWDVASGRSLLKVHTPPTHPFAIALSPDGQALATVDGVAIHLWSAVSGTQLRLLPGDLSRPFLSANRQLIVQVFPTADRSVLC